MAAIRANLGIGLREPSQFASGPWRVAVGCATLNYSERVRYVTTNHTNLADFDFRIVWRYEAAGTIADVDHEIPFPAKTETEPAAVLESCRARCPARAARGRTRR